MSITPLVIVGSSVAATLAVLLVFAAGWIAARRIAPVTPREPAARKTSFDLNTGAGTCITMADVRERLRRLEAIAAGIDL